jgi:serine/threonine-protein kinase
VIARALAKQADRRFADAAGFAAALAEASRAPVPAGGPSVTHGPAPAAAPAADGATWDDEAAAMAALIPRIVSGEAEPAALGRLARRLSRWAEGTLTGWRAELAERLAREVWPVLVARAVDAAPIPGRPVSALRADWLETLVLAKALSRLFAAQGRRPADPADPDGLERLRERFSEAFLAYSGPLSAALFAEDDPDLVRISLDFMRLDSLQVGLEELGGEAHLARTRTYMLTMASQVMRKVTAVIARFTETGDALARFGVANLLMEIEDLIVMADRLVEQAPSGPLDGGAEGLAGDVIGDFAGQARKLIAALLGELADAVDGSGPAEDFPGKLRQLGLLSLFASRIDAGRTRPQMMALVAEVHRGVADLAERVIRRAEALPPGTEGPQADRIDAQLAALWDLTEEFGWPDLGQWLLAELRRRVLGGQAA